MIKEKSEKNSNIELLRIIAMLLIVMHHYSVHGFDLTLSPYLGDRLIYNLFLIGGKIGVDIFVLISGYYMCKSKFTLKKCLKLIGQILFYSCIIFLIFKFFIKTGDTFNLLTFFYNIFSTVYYQYWFATTYIYLMLLSPFLNKIINKFSNKAYFRFILFLILIYSFIPSFTTITIPIDNLGAFIIMYFIAGYIRNYPQQINIKNKTILAIILYILIFIFSMYNEKYYAQNSLFVLLFSIYLLQIFINKKPKYSKMINILGGATFGVYLIHDNYLVRNYIWKEIFKNQQYYGSGYLIIHAIITVFIVYIVCTIIELIRKKTIEKLWMNFVDKSLEPYLKEKSKSSLKIIYKLKKRYENNEPLIQDKFIINSLILISVFMIILSLFLEHDLIFTLLSNGLSKTEMLYKLVSYLIPTIFLIIPMIVVLTYIVNKIKNYKFNNYKDYILIIFKIIVCFLLILMIMSYHSISVKDIFVMYIKGDVNIYMYWLLIMIIILVCFSNIVDDILTKILKYFRGNNG